MFPARSVYLATSFIWGLLFWLMVTVFMVYQVEVVRLDPLQLVLVGTALEVSAFIFEVPTGIVADTYSRRLSVVVGYFITGLGFLLMGLVPTFLALVAASFLWGIGWTFVSGAHQAWLADEIGEAAAAATYLAGARIGNYGAFLGILFAVFVGSVDTGYPIVVSGALFCLFSIALFFAMPETGFKGREAASYGVMFKTLKEGVAVIRGSSTLLLLMLVGVVFGTFSEGYDRLAVAHLIREFPLVEYTGMSTVVLFGTLAAMGILLSIGAVSLAERTVDINSARQLAIALSLATALIIVSVIMFALTGHAWLALAMYLLIQPMRSVTHPLTMAWFNRNIPSSSRATVISLHSQSDALGQMAGGPGVGLIGRDFGVRVAISAAALLLLPALWLYGHAIRNASQLDS